MNASPTSAPIHSRLEEQLRQTYQPQPLTDHAHAEQFVGELTQTSEPGAAAILAILFYGSRLHAGMATATSTPDYYVIVDSYAGFYGGGGRPQERRWHRLGWLHAQLNRMLPPNIYRYGSSKYSVISLNDLERETSARAADVYHVGRFSKRLAVVYLKRPEVLSKIVRCCLHAMQQAVQRSLPLLPNRFSPDEAILAALRLSYTGEPRVEATDKVKKIFASQTEFYRQFFLPILDDTAAKTTWLDQERDKTHYRRGECRAAQRQTKRFIRRSRRRALLRWPKYVVTVKDWAGYMLVKIERTQRWQIEVKPYEKRWPLLFCWKYIWLLRRKKMLK